MSKQLEIVVYNTYFKVAFPRDISVFYKLKPITGYLSSYKLMWNPKSKRPYMVLDREWFYYDEDEHVIYFPIGVLMMVCNELKRHGYELTTDNVRAEKSITIAPMEGSFRSDKFTLRDYQDAYQDVITSPTSPSFNLVDLKTGAGKTLISFYCITKIGQRVGIVLLPRYITKWIEDVEKYTNIPKERVFVVQGLDSLNRLLSAPSVNYDIIIFSITTLSLFNKAYETKEKTICPPYEVFNRLRIGVLLSDESHQALGSLSRIIMYSNVKKVIGLSATFLSNQEDDKKFQNLLFPASTRITNIVKFDNYIEGYACPYRIAANIKIKDKRQKSYSHVLFEQSIMSNKKLLASYLDMIDYYLEIGYLNRKKPGEKCLIFFGTINMCTYAKKYFESKYKKLIVKRFVGEDEYDDMQKGELIISTLGSFGTALETSNLITVLQTVSIKSAIANIQSCGRLRKLDKTKTRFYSIYCSTLQSHAYLQKTREEVLRNMVKLWKVSSYTKTLPYDIKD